MREDIRLYFDSDMASELGKKDNKGKCRDKRIVHVSDHICLSLKKQVSEKDVLILPVFNKAPIEKTNSIIEILSV